MCEKRERDTQYTTLILKSSKSNLSICLRICSESYHQHSKGCGVVTSALHQGLVLHSGQVGLAALCLPAQLFT